MRKEYYTFYSKHTYCISCKCIFINYDIYIALSVSFCTLPILYASCCKNEINHLILLGDLFYLEVAYPF